MCSTCSKVIQKKRGRADAYLEPSGTSTMDLFCGNSQRLLAVYYFCKKAPSLLFDWVLSTLLGSKVK